MWKKISTFFRKYIKEPLKKYVVMPCAKTWEKLCDKYKFFNAIDCFYYRIRDKYRSFRTWLRYSCNKTNFKFIKTAITAYPYDYEYLQSVQLAQLRAMKQYFDKRLYTTDDTYDEMLRWLNLAIKLLEIVNEKEHELYHMTGELKFVPCKDNPNLSEVDCSGSHYYCDVYVNTKNARRFVRENFIPALTLHEHELYLVKCRYLYHRILFEHLQSWWD